MCLFVGYCDRLRSGIESPKVISAIDVIEKYTAVGDTLFDVDWNGLYCITVTNRIQMFEDNLAIFEPFIIQGENKGHLVFSEEFLAPKRAYILSELYRIQPKLIFMLDRYYIPIQKSFPDFIDYLEDNYNEISINRSKQLHGDTFIIHTRTTGICAAEGGA